MMDRAPRWQFSLKMMLAMTAVVACMSATVSAEPSWVTGLVLAFLTFAIPAALLMVVIYGRGYWRTFAIGALIPIAECSFVSVMAVLLDVFFKVAAAASPQPSVPNIDFEALGSYFEEFAMLFRAGAAVYWTFAVVIGFFSVGIRWLVERGGVNRAPAAPAEPNVP